MKKKKKVEAEMQAFKDLKETDDVGSVECEEFFTAEGQDNNETHLYIFKEQDQEQSHQHRLNVVLGESK